MTGPTTARAVLTANDRGGYAVPNGRVYPFQWNWDSAFVAMGYALLDEDRAWTELDSLMRGQWRDGMVPHIIFHAPADGYYPGPDAWRTSHVPPTSGITQPPVAASAAWRVFGSAKDKELARRRAAALLPRLDAWHRWWSDTRDQRELGIVCSVHPWESGRDNSPEWDSPLESLVPTVHVAALRQDNKRVDPSERPTDLFYDRVMTLVDTSATMNWDQARIARESAFRVCDLGIQCILARAEHDLALLADALGDATVAEAARGRAARLRLGTTLLQAPDGTYRSRDLVRDELVDSVTSATFLPLYAGAVDEDGAALLAGLFDEWTRSVQYMVPSMDPRDPRFDPKRYWRGPVWLMMNWMIAQGFASYGFDSIADRIRTDAGTLLRLSGFSEYFDPRDGAPLGGRDFSWTASVGLTWGLIGPDDPLPAA
ncbi:MAG: trehalase family glycosidase [Alsobacter sp.]